MNVLLLKSSSDDCEWVALPGNVSTVSPLGFEFVNDSDLRMKLDNPDGYSGIVCTSQRTVEAVRRCSSGQLDEKWTAQLPCYVVGPGTAAKVRDLLKWSHDLVIGQESGSAEQLIKLLPNEARPLLYPCGQMETLSKHLKDLSRLDKVVAYQTCKSPNLEKELGLLPTTLEVVVFFSPSGVKYAFQNLIEGKILKHVVAIGPTTNEALLKALPESVSLHQAESPSPEGVKHVLESIMTSA